MAARLVVVLLLAGLWACAPPPEAPSPPQPPPASPSPGPPGPRPEHATVEVPIPDHFGMRPEENPFPDPLPEELWGPLAPDAEVYYRNDRLNLERDPDVRPFQVMAAIELRPGQVVADVGAGHGYFSWRFSRVVGPSGKVYALDVDPKSVEYMTRKKAWWAGLRPEDGFPNVEPRLSQVDDVGLEPESIDLAFVCQVHVFAAAEHHDPSIGLGQVLGDEERAFEIIRKGSERFAASIHRALRPDGRLVVLERHRRFAPSLDLDEEGMIRVVESFHFRLESSPRVLPNDALMIFRKG